MNLEEIRQYLRTQRLAVITSLSAAMEPQAALVGIAVTNQLEIIFDTLKNTRKYQNLGVHNKVALVIGWDEETTVQYEGQASELTGPDADSFKEIYFSVWPDGRQRAANWPGLVHFKVSPAWIRYSNFNDPPRTEEWHF
jgi:hypothetical protein